MTTRNNNVLAAYQAELIMESTSGADTDMSSRVTAINFRADKGTIPTTSIESKVATERPVINRRSADITFLATDDNITYLKNAETDSETKDYYIKYSPNGTSTGDVLITAIGFLRSDNRMVAASAGQSIQTSWHINSYTEGTH